MPKRKNPFGESTPLQLKTHVGFKQNASQHELHEMYARTQAILFEGANPSAHINGKQVCSAQKMKTVGVADPVKGANGLSKQLAPVTPLSCPCCLSGGACPEARCSFCDRAVCHDCLRCCSICGESYCSLCSVLNYDATEVRSFCLGCLPSS